MRLAFGIVTLMPWGGLQRDCLRLARCAQDQGHEVTIFVARKLGALPDDLDIRVLTSPALTNYGRNRRFAKALARATAGDFDHVIGFDKIPGLDILYCGDMSFAESHRDFWARISPRHRVMNFLESTCFSPGSNTMALMLSEPQLRGYQKMWGTPDHRLKLLPPPLDPERRKPQLRGDGTRERVREELGLATDELALLCIGASPWRKGFDRAIAALTKINHAKVLIAGVTSDDQFIQKLLSSRKYSDLKNRVSLLGHRSDISQLIAAADLLLHPARSETTGTVILEALVNGLAAITTSICGFSHYVSTAKAGTVLPEPFALDALVTAIADSTLSQREVWSDNGVAYGIKDETLYSGLDTALSVITGHRASPARSQGR